MNYENLANQFKTPLFVYNFDEIKNRFENLKKSFRGRKSLICYAVKANSNLSLLKFLSDMGSGFDCVSFNEIKRALIAGANPYKIIFSGVGKTDNEIYDSLKEDILFINVESFEELKLIENIAKQLNCCARISVRVNPNVDAKTHPYISTGLMENKFGVDIQTATQMYIYSKKSIHLQPIGIHFHIGSQICDINPILQSAKIISELTQKLRSLDIDIKFFDVGGGLGVTYKDEIEPNLYDYSQGILSALNGQDLTIICEPGRYMVAKSGILLTRVLREKTNNNKRFVIVDAAMNDILRPSLYNAYHEIIDFKNNNNKTLCDVVGPICESGDFLAKGIYLPKLESGDLLCIKNAGAYCFSMSSNYNSRIRPAQVAIVNSDIKQISKREEFDDIIALEKEYIK